MQDEHRQAIQKNFSTLVERTDLDTVVSLLYEKGVFSEAMIEPYKDRNKDERHRKRQLYRDIERRGPNAFRALINTLTETGNWDVVRELEPNSVLNPDPRHPPRPPSDQFNSISKRNNDKRIKIEKEIAKLQLGPDVHPDPPHSKLDPNFTPQFKVVKSTKFVEFGPDGREPYSTRSRHRGALLIFSFMEFQNNIERYRRGAEVDCDNLVYLFGEIGFGQTGVYRNLEKAEMLQAISALDQMRSLENVDCVFVVVSSHGYERYATSDTDIRCSDGGLVSSLAIIERFNNRRCPQLKNIPKVFIFQMCRGSNTDTLSPPGHMIQPDNRVESDGQSIQDAPYSDILIAHSTLPGFVSYRDPLLGSFYIQALCEVFAAHAHDHHIKDLLELVDEKLKEKFHVQTSSVDSWGFNKKLYLHPGLFED